MWCSIENLLGCFKSRFNIILPQLSMILQVKTHTELPTSVSRYWVGNSQDKPGGSFIARNRQQVLLSGTLGGLLGLHHSYTCLSKCNSSLPRTLQHLLCFLHLLSKDCPGLQCSGHCVGLASLWPQIGAGSAGGFGVYWTAFEYCLELSYIHQWGWSLIGKLLFHCVPD